LGRTPQKNFGGEKHAKFGAISDALNKKYLVNFGPLTPEITRLMFTHPNQFFRKAIFWPLGGAAPPNFYRS